MPNPAQVIDDPWQMRRAGRDLLSLALIDARNRSLRWLTAFDAFDAQAAAAEFEPPAWLVGRAAWLQEAWIARNVRRARGEHSDAGVPRLASIEPQTDEQFDAHGGTRRQRWQRFGTEPDGLREYLAATLETTLELLERCDDSDAALYFYRCALWHEDRCAETLAALAQAAGLGADKAAAASAMPLPWPARARRDALWLPAQRFSLGSAPGGFVPDNEKWAHDEAVPEFEIDAQAVQWSQFAEFIDDKGYDEPRWWSREGWAWLQATGRRAPRYVEQAGAAVLARRFGTVQRVAAAQAAVHLAWYEADAWSRWAGRRLPTEVEWELAAHSAASRGFVWGDVWEWTAGSARAWPGHASGPAGIDAVPPPGSQRSLRGASCLTVPRARHPKVRRFGAPERDELFCGLRSCTM